MLNDSAPNGDTIFATETARMCRVVSAHVRSATEPDPSVPICTVVYEITCATNVLNPMGSMHGGCIATLYDNFSTYAVGALDKYWDDYDPTRGATALQDYGKILVKKVMPDLAVTRMLQVIYHRAIKPGSKVFLEVNLVSDTRRFSTHTAKMYDDKGRVYSFMTHDKVKGAAPPPTAGGTRAAIVPLPSVPTAKVKAML